MFITYYSRYVLLFSTLAKILVPPSSNGPEWYKNCSFRTGAKFPPMRPYLKAVGIKEVMLFSLLNWMHPTSNLPSFGPYIQAHNVNKLFVPNKLTERLFRCTHFARNQYFYASYYLTNRTSYFGICWFFKLWQHYLKIINDFFTSIKLDLMKRPTKLLNKSFKVRQVSL